MELPAFEAWLKDTLNSDSALRSAAPGGVHPDLRRPQGQDSKKAAVVFSLADEGEDETGMCGTRQFCRPLYLVRAVAQTSSMQYLSDASTRIDALLDQATGTFTVSGITWRLWITRESVYRVPLFTNGIEYYQLGGQYRVTLARQ